MKHCKIIGIDFAKNVFQVHGSDRTGKKLFFEEAIAGAGLGTSAVI